MDNLARISETGIEKVFLHTEKVKEILENDISNMNTYPVSVELTLTNRCNLNCCYCSDKGLREREGISEELSFEILKRLFIDLKNGGTKGIVIEGGGEPTLHRDFDKIIETAKEVGMSVGLITNGTSNLSKKTLKEFQWIRVSLDASNADEYKALKGVDAFEVVLQNLKKYKQNCQTVGIGYVVTKNNIKNLDDIIVRLRDIGVDYVQLRPVVDCPSIELANVNFDYLKNFESKEFYVDTSGFKNNSFKGNGGVPCYASSLTSIISGDGNVYICGRLNIYDWLKPIGNIKETTFKDIWNGEERIRQLEMIKDISFCEKKCPQCRISKYNLFFDSMRRIKTIDFI
ncbi:radical SAM protein [Butyrivibrio sp. NC3005]|uniref:radical SAM protein n=1 Tax=Butyrivibrio sp. NC3005 TaxID=1280685 RepID=UPI00041E6E08|nr:radical SAM protein [Butyrivibrio sp. NC3005]